MKREKNKYGFRKNVIKSVIGFSIKVDDSLEGMKREIMVLLVKFFIVLFALILLFLAICNANIVQSLLFSIVFLSSILSWLAQIKRYRLVVALRQLKEVKE